MLATNNSDGGNPLGVPTPGARSHVLRLMLWMSPGLLVGLVSWAVLFALYGSFAEGTTVAFGVLQAVAFTYCAACCAVYIAFDVKARVLAQRTVMMESLQMFLSQYKVDVEPYPVPEDKRKTKRGKGKQEEEEELHLLKGKSDFSHLEEVLDSHEDMNRAQRQKGREDLCVDLFRRIVRFQKAYTSSSGKATLVDYENFVDQLRDYVARGMPLPGADSNLSKEEREVVAELQARAERSNRGIPGSTTLAYTSGGVVKHSRKGASAALEVRDVSAPPP